MGLVYATVTLINGENLILTRRHIIDKDEMKQLPYRCPLMVVHI